MTDDPQKRREPLPPHWQRWTVKQDAKHALEQAAAKLADLPAEEDAQPVLDEMRARIEAVAPRPPFATKLVTVGADWIDRTPPPQEYVLTTADGQADGVLPRGIVAMLAAMGSTGKSYLLIALALAIAAGTETCGLRAQRGRVLLVLGEESTEQAWRRIHAQAHALGLSADQLGARLVLFPAAGSRLALTREGGEETRFAHDLREYLSSDSAGDWSAIMLDPLSRFGGLDVETDNAAATRLVEVFETLAQVPGKPTVIVATHTPKGSRGPDGTPEPRGSSALWDGARFVWAMAKPHDAQGEPIDELAELWTTKTNYTKPQPRTLLARNPDGSVRAATPEERNALQRSQAKGKQTPTAERARDDGPRSASPATLADADTASRFV